MKKLGVVILNWNAPDDTIKCVRSVLDAFPEKCEIVVVDNGSTDNSVAKIAQAVNGISIIQTNANLGYAGGNNCGLRAVFEHGCDFGFILNNDCTLLHSRGLQKIVASTDVKTAIYGLGVAESGGRGSANFKKSNKDFFGILLALAGHNASLVDTVDFSLVDRVSGAAMVVNRFFFESAGPIDERYFLYTEEIDYCLKARANGWGVVHEASDCASVKHSRQGTYDRPYVWYYMYRNMILFCKFNFQSYKLFVALFLCFGVQIKGLCKMLALRNPAVIKMMCNGFKDGIFGKIGIMR